MEMTGWMIIFSALITLAIIVQAGALLGMFLHIRRVSSRMEDLQEQVSGRLNSISQEVQRQTHNLGDKANETAAIVKAEISRLENDIARVRTSADAAMQTVHEIGRKIDDTVARLIYLVNTPAREANALSKGIQTGLRVLFSNSARAEQCKYKRTA